MTMTCTDWEVQIIPITTILKNKVYAGAKGVEVQIIPITTILKN